MVRTYSFPVWLAILILAASSSFTILIQAEDAAKSEEKPDVEETSSQEDTKEKRSQEEIMFGNQQNRPNGLVDDLMSMSESMEDSSNASQAQEGGASIEQTSQDETQRELHSGYADWDKDAAYQDALPMVDLVKSLYDPKVFFQPMRMERPLRKRSLRSSIGQMIQKRGIRLPRRSMRLKRQVDVEDLLNMFENERFYNEDAQVTPHSFSGRARTVAKRHVPVRFSGETPEYRYPYIFQHRNSGILPPDDIDVEDLLLLPPNSRYIDTSQDTSPYGTRGEEKNEGIQKWLNRHTVPSVLSKRASPFFYPIDYRYIPGYRKRSNGNEASGRFMDEEADSDFGKWGHVVQVPEAYASPEDIARLYGLANLLSEGDNYRKRRST